jgi:tetratricopeptide (TPR) repeat protein
LLNKARLLEARGRGDLAVQTWQQILASDPNVPEALAGMARAAKQQGHEQEARGYLDRLKRINPNDPAINGIENMVSSGQQRSRLDEASKLAQARQYDKAMAIYREVFGTSPPAGPWAVAYYETDAATPGGWERATAGLRTLLVKNPDNFAYRLSLGKLLTYRPGSRLAGIEVLENVKDGGLYEKQAQTAWRQALIWENGSWASVASLRKYLAHAQDPELDALLKRAEKQGPPAKGGAAVAEGGKDLQLGYVALNANRLDEAAARFQAVLKVAPKNGSAFAGLGYVHMKKQDFAGAVENFEAAKAQMPATAELNDAISTSHFWLDMQDAARALKEQRSDDAEALFQKALALRPAELSALEGYAGALMQRGDLAGAAPVLERLVRAQPENAEAWRTLVNAKYQKAGAKAALVAVKQIPVKVAAKLNEDLEYLIVLTSIYRDAGDAVESRRAFQQAALLGRNKKDLPEGMQLQLAGLYLQYADPADAAALYQRLIDVTPENLDAWEGLMLALHRAKDYQRALRTLEELPATVRPNALARPGFLRAVASLQTAIGNLGSAETLLRRAIELESAKGATPSFYTQLQLAQIWLDQGQHDRAIRLFGELVKNYPDNPDSWKGLMLALHTEKRDTEALDIAHRIPADTGLRLQDDSDYLGLLSSIYSANGENDEALRTIRQAVARYQGTGEKIPADLSLQLGWLLLGDDSSRRELYLLIQELRARTDLTVDQRQTVSEILTTWILRSADAAMSSGATDRAVAVLEAGMRAIPSDQRIRRALAGDLLAMGDPKRALALYKNAGLKNASAADYVAAAGTALAERESQLGETWLAEGLKKYPADPDLLNMAGRQAAAKGDFKKAEVYFRRALQAIHITDRTTATLAPGGATDELGSMLINGAPPNAVATTARPATQRLKLKDTLEWLNDPVVAPPPSNDLRHLLAPDAPAPGKGKSPQSYLRPYDGAPDAVVLDPEPQDVEPGSLIAVALGRREAAGWITEPPQRIAPPQWDAPANITLVSARSAPLADFAGDPQAPPAITADPLDDLLRGQTPLVPQSAAPLAGPTTNGITPAGEISKSQQIEDQLKEMEDRNTPYLGMGGLFQARSGQPGFDKMTIQETDIEASTIVSNSMRLSLVARGIFLNSPAPTGTATLRFGLLPVGDTFAAQAFSGLGADAQLATTNFGMHIGESPRSFPVHNILGGLRFRPGGGPITLIFDRDDLRDSIIAYAGARDPLSNIAWGGVVSNSAQLVGNWGNERAGTYFSTGFQYITGKNVENNQRIDGTVGAYWRLATFPVGSLTAGVNIFAMHYTNNLRYFTLGQGGYFSPQRFLLFNVPVSWTGSWKHLQYTASASIGSQSFSENASPFFPTSLALQTSTGSYYPDFSNSGTNYNVDFRLAYQISPHWYVGGYFNANNANFYTLQTVGITVRYSFLERPLDTGFTVPNIPDWKGRQPFGLP